ncbi:hypothetical protein FKM82_025197, partial [Ascaphus truei]
MMRFPPFALRGLFADVAHPWVPCRRLVTGEVTPGRLVHHWLRLFETHGVSEPRESSEIIIAHALGAKT